MKVVGQGEMDSTSEVWAVGSWTLAIAPSLLAPILEYFTCLSLCFLFAKMETPGCLSGRPVVKVKLEDELLVLQTLALSHL
jgi:hypothetical protein